MEQHTRGVRRRRLVGLVLAAGWLGGCGPQAPVRIGWLAEAHGADVNFGEDARNGVTLAIEERNAAGGIAGQPLELVVQTYPPGGAPAALRALGAAGVRVMVGPFGTQLALELLPVADAAGVLMLSPTVTSNALVGRDDQLLRLDPTNRDSAQATARMLHAGGHRRVAIAQDLRKAADAVPWGDAFRAAFDALGGTVTGTVGFGTDPELTFEAVMQYLLARQPDTLLFVAGGADAAGLAQQAHKRGTGVTLAAAGWAATPALLELGGQAVEGLLVVQAHDPQDTSARYRAFEQAFQSRFDATPGYIAAAAYDATLVLSEALARARAGETPKEALLRHGPYQGLQQSVAFDRFGDAGRMPVATVVRGGRFVRWP